MAKRKLTPLAQAIHLCNELSDSDKETLADLLRVGKPRKSPAPSAAKRSSTKPAPKDSTASTGTEKDGAGTVNANAIKYVREGAGVDRETAKAALIETGGDMETAIALLKARAGKANGGDGEQPTA